MTGSRRVLGAWLPAFLVLYLAAQLWASRGITVESVDGFQGIMNALVAAGAGNRTLTLILTRPPLGWLLLAPPAAVGFLWGGSLGALRACHAVMPFLTVGMLWLCHRFYRRLYSPIAAACALVLLAFNPLIVHYAAFTLFDILSAAAMIAFLWSAWRWLQEPDAASYCVMLGAYVAAVAARYQLCIFVLVPLTYLILARRSLRTRLWLLPPLAYAAILCLLAAVRAIALHDGLLRSFRQAHEDLFGGLVLLHLVQNAIDPTRGYFASLVLQLAPPLLCLAAWGAWLCRARRGPLGAFLVLALFVPLAFMSFLVRTKEDRYLIPLLPLVYAFVAESLDALRELARARAPGRGVFLALVCLGAAPWRQSVDAWLFLAKERSLRTTMPWELGALLNENTPQGGCVAWTGDSIFLHGDLPVMDRDVQGPAIMDVFIPLLTNGKLFAPSGLATHGGCPTAMAVATPGPGKTLAEVRRLADGARWEVDADGIRPAAGGRSPGPGSAPASASPPKPRAPARSPGGRPDPDRG